MIMMIYPYSIQGVNEWYNMHQHATTLEALVYGIFAIIGIAIVPPPQEMENDGCLPPRTGVFFVSHHGKDSFPQLIEFSTMKSIHGGK